MAQTVVIHILAVFGTPIPHPLALRPGENCVLGHRIVESDEPLLANGQQFIAGLEVDASFTQGGGLFLTVVKVRCRSGVTEVYFRWPTSQPDHYVMSLLRQFDYQVVDEAESIVGMLPAFFPEASV